MANEDFVTLNADEWAIYAQPDGPNTEPIYLRCHDADDIEAEFGDIELKFRPDPQRKGKYLVTGAFQQEPSAPTVEITASIRKTKDILSAYQKCPAPLYFHDVCGQRQIFGDWDSQAIILDPAFLTGNTYANVAKKMPGDNDESTKAFPFSAVNITNPFKPSANSRLSIAETAGLNAIDICGVDKCTDYCGQGLDTCQNILVAGDAVSGSPADTANPWYSTDSGVSFTEDAAAPFGVTEDIAAIICIPLGNDTYRRIAFNGTTQPGNPAESAYSDDGGATWTNVNVGTTNAQYFLSGKSVVYTPEGNAIWAVTTGGYIYKSTDKGLTWSAVHSGTLTTNALHAIRRFGRNLLVAVGATDTILKSEDGGTSWAALTATGGGNTLNTVAPVTKYRYWVGDSGGDMYYTEDGGTTWSQRSFSGDGVGSVNDIAFAENSQLFGFMIHDTAAPVGYVYYTRNGGYDWDKLPTATNAGLNMIHVCSPDEALVVGEASGGTAVILKVAPAPAEG